jgi:putative glutamine amidotransferase
MKPRIGVTVSQTREPALQRLFNGTALQFSKGVLEAGGLPVMLPVLPGTEADQLERLDGVLFSGGVDVDPEFWGADHERGMGEVDPERDAFEMTLYRLARDAAKPVLGICRGFQLVNIAEGGTMHQHLPNVSSSWVDHAQTARPPVYGHRARLLSGSSLARGYGADSVRVNSYHHQGVKDVAPGLQATAYAPDGLVEGLETRGVIAVQWHPELLFEAHTEHLAPFRALIEMCQPVTA